MKITGVKAIYPKWQHLPAGVWQSHFWQIIVEIRTDQGTIGLGYGGGGQPAVEIINTHYKELLIGSHLSNTDDIESIWNKIYFNSIPYGRTGIPIMALSAVDIALWDLLAKAQSIPVYELLGGITKSKVRAYASSNNFEREKDAGFTAVKFSTTWNRDVHGYEYAESIASKARSVFGPDALIMADCYMSWDREIAINMAKVMSPHNLYWFEDVLTPNHLVELSEIRPIIKPILLAGGEHEFSHHGFSSIAKNHSMDIWQPDLTWCGGFTAGKRIIEIASKYGISVVPHRGGEIWGLHFIAATSCDNLAETHPDRWLTNSDKLWIDEPIPQYGYLSLPDRPGFGVTLNEQML